MRSYPKHDFPVAYVRKYLEPGPIVLISSAYRGKTNLMTLGWQTVMEFSPSLVGCMISDGNHSFEMIRRSRECVINVPTVDLAKPVVQIGNCSGDAVDKFAKFGLTPEPAAVVKAQLVRECVANFECRLADARMVNRYNFFIFEVVKAHVARSPAYPNTLHYHYHGRGIFSSTGRRLDLRKATHWKWPIT